MVSSTKAECHPDRLKYCKGLCQPCYRRLAWETGQRDKYYFKRYGLSPEQVKTIQKMGCCICGKKERLNVDHDHTTGRVRGVLCFKCNIMVGYIEYGFDLLPRAFKYLNKKVRLEW